MRIGINLLWVRPGICGGTESFIRNLMDGFASYDRENEYVLFTTEDNYASFENYKKYSSMTLRKCPTVCASQAKRIFWENTHLDRMAKREKVDVMFIPVYSKPARYGSGIPYVCVIHDLQALHYPQYFSVMRRNFLRFMWWFACRTSDRIITDSDYCRQDLLSRYPWIDDKTETIYIPVITKSSNMDSQVIEDKYHIQAGRYFYCVSAMLPHKNLSVILRAMALMKKEDSSIRLVISGVGGQNQEFDQALRELDIEDVVVQTGFISNEERDCLYENCSLFLFPSIFEGFGMPPVEAMRKGKNVVMTKKSCLEEVTEGKAIYVEDPFDEKEWIEKIKQAQKQPAKAELFEKYELKNVVWKYLEVFSKTGKEL